MSTKPLPLIPMTTLELHGEAIRAETEVARAHLIPSSGSAEQALRYFLVSSEPGALARCGLGTLNEKDVFYNRYYWFRRFAKLHQAHYGYDAGIEDQVSQLLEQAPSDVDWSIVERLSKEE